MLLDFDAIAENPAFETRWRGVEREQEGDLDIHRKVP
jgi:hypothetical protein